MKVFRNKLFSNYEYRVLVTNARSKLDNALARGILTKKPCAVCGDSKVEGHHEDYAKPLDITWLCRIHHRPADIAMRKRIIAASTLDCVNTDTIAHNTD